MMTAPLSKFQEALETAEKYEPEKPQPLVRSLPPADPYPAEALGSVLYPAMQAVQGMTQAPDALCAQSVLAAANLAVQGLGNVETPAHKIRPVSCFFLSIAQSGERKTACDEVALAPIRAYENTLIAGHAQEKQKWVNQRDVYERMRNQILNDKKKFVTFEDKEQAIQALGNPPKAPYIPKLTCQEPTIEGLYIYLAEARPSIGLFNGEGGQFIAGHGMSDDAKTRTSTGLSHLWDGTPIDRIRATDGNLYLRGRRFCVHLMAQPDIAAIMLSDPVLMNQGLLSRFLVCAPQSNFGQREFQEPTLKTIKLHQDYCDHMKGILELRLPFDEEKDGLKPPVIQFSNEAKTIWKDFYNEIERQLKPGGPYETITGFVCKVPEHAARLAAVLALIENSRSEYISEENIQNAITLARYYLAEAVRLYNAQKTNGRLKLAQITLDWLHKEWPHDVVSLPDLYQRGPNRVRDKDTAYQIVRTLEDHHWLTQIPDGAEVAGTKRREVWRIHPPLK